MAAFTVIIQVILSLLDSRFCRPRALVMLTHIAYSWLAATSHLDYSLIIAVTSASNRGPIKARAIAMALNFTRFPLLDISNDDTDPAVRLVSKKSSEHSADMY